MIRLSVLIITFNEENNIGECIRSVKEVADEVLIIDSFSKDRTVPIAESLGAKVITNTFESYTHQKNFAIDKAIYPHILSIDADERLSDELIESIKTMKESWSCSAYSINRKNFYAGRWIRYGGWYPDIKIRMFRKGKGRWTGKLLHESFQVYDSETVCHLDGDLLHFTYNSREEHLEKSRKYAELGAKANMDKNYPILVLKLIFSPGFRFIKTYVLRYGFLDGLKGFWIAEVSFREAWLKYLYAIRFKRTV